MLYEMAIADAYAIAFEFVPDSADRPNDLSGYHRHPTYTDVVPGRYTDDTQRGIANAEMVMESFLRPSDNRLFSPVAYVAQYQSVFARDPRPGYSRRFEAFLKENLETDPTEMMLKLERRPTNGAVMGSAVLGFLSEPSQVMMAAAAQAISTHSYETIPYAQIVAMSAHFVINDLGPLSDLTPWLYRHLSDSGEQVKEFLSRDHEKPETVTMQASSAVELMLYALPRYNSLSALTQLAVEVGGDTDSAAAIMVAVASESRHYVDDFPTPLRDGLGNDYFGNYYLKQLDRDLKSSCRRRRQMMR